TWDNSRDNLGMRFGHDKNIRRYVATTKDQYIPKEDELCIAKFGNEFHRTLCIKSAVTNTHSLLYFLDYGNTQYIHHRDIRIFAREFTRLAPYGVVCNLSPMMPQQISYPLMKRLSKLIEEVQLQPVPIQIIDVEPIPNDEDGTLRIDIPHIRNILAQEMLI
ncbi:hypothetical protein QAD02_001371, partial [Eretmocerus hayati]